MKTFIWEVVDELTDEFHSSGGLVVIAETIQKARILVPQIKDQKPDFEYKCEGIDVEKVFVFPNVGCC